MARDPLRSTLDKLEVDPEAAKDRPYLEAALRRMGYTETEIRERLAQAEPPAQPTEYRLVRPVLATGERSASPFEDLQGNELDFSSGRVEFDAVEASEVSFDEVGDEPEVAFEQAQPGEETAEEEETRKEREGLQWQEIQQQRKSKGLAWDETQEPAQAAEELAEAAEPIEEPADDTIDTFGSTGGDGAGARTRVRVRRVRAGSRQEAEDKVAGPGRRVIKSIPVDIVERWGASESSEKGAR